MPSAKVLEEKKQIVENLKEKINSAVSLVLVDYKGISVEDDTKMRTEMRKADVDYFVIKNNLLKLAFMGSDYEKLCEVLDGTTAVAISKDEVSGAKIIDSYATRLKKVMKIKAGFVEKEVYDAEQMTAISKIPPKEVLLATLLAGFNSPIQKFVMCLDQIAKQQSA